jgi:hypothetical protein
MADQLPKRLLRQIAMVDAANAKAKSLRDRHLDTAITMQQTMKELKELRTRMASRQTDCTDVQRLRELEDAILDATWMQR